MEGPVDLFEKDPPAKMVDALTSVRLLGRRSAVPDDFSRARLDRDCEPGLWAERIRTYPDRRLQVSIFARNRFHGDAPAPARPPLSKLAGNPPPS